MFRWRLLIIPVLTFTMLILIGCMGVELHSDNLAVQSEKVKITFWDDNAGPQRTPIWDKLIQMFERENPAIDIEYVGLPKDYAKSKFDAAIAADDMPDVASIYTSWLPEKKKQGGTV